MIYDALLRPFAELSSMQHALLGACILSLGACPIGVFLMLRRMSLTGDAMSHAILPGVAIGFLVSGLSLLPMTIGGFIAGLAVALAAGAVSRLTAQREDASLAAFYLISLALGVLLVSSKGSGEELLHVLFGDALALDGGALILIATVATVTLLGLAVLWRALVAECLDPLYLRSVSRIGLVAHVVFLVLVVLNLVAGFRALGSLLAVGLMMLPAASARFWCRTLEPMILLAIAFGMASSAIGLLIAVRFAVESGPAVILAAGVVYVVSMLAGPFGIGLARRRRTRAPARIYLPKRSSKA